MLSLLSLLLPTPKSLALDAREPLLFCAPLSLSADTGVEIVAFARTESAPDISASAADERLPREVVLAAGEMGPARTDRVVEVEVEVFCCVARDSATNLDDAELLPVLQIVGSGVRSRKKMCKYIWWIMLNEG